jgi:hypothetical protein
VESVRLRIVFLFGMCVVVLMASWHVKRELSPPDTRCCWLWWQRREWEGDAVRIGA